MRPKREPLSLWLLLRFAHPWQFLVVVIMLLAPPAGTNSRRQIVTRATLSAENIPIR